MSWNSTICGKCFHTQEFYGRLVPACPKCGYPELKTSEEYLRAMGVTPKSKPPAHWKQEGWNDFVLTHEGKVQHFTTFANLWHHCNQLGLDATQV